MNFIACNRDFERKQIAGTEEYVNSQIKKIEQKGYYLKSRIKRPFGKSGKVMDVAHMTKPKLERRI